MRTIPDKFKRDYESGNENRKIMEAYQRVLNPNPMIDEDATADALGTLKAILKSSDGDIKKMADGMMKSYEKNKGFSKDQANWIYKTSKALFDSTMYEDSTEDAKKTLDAIIGSTKDDGGDIYKMAIGMRKSYEKNKGFSQKQAQWIYNTSKSMFKESIDNLDMDEFLSEYGNVVGRKVDPAARKRQQQEKLKRKKNKPRKPTGNRMRSFS